MEGVTNPEMLEGRAFYKLGEFTHDHNFKLVIAGIVFCITLSSLILMSPNWAESWGTGDLESVEAYSAIDEVFPKAGESFTLIVHHDSLNHTSVEWQSAVMSALADFESNEHVTIQYSWDTTLSSQEDVVYLDEDGSMWTRNIIKMDINRKDAKSLYTELAPSVKIEDGFEAWKTDGTAIEATFDTRIQEDLVTAEIVSGPLSLIILGIVFGTIIAALLPLGIGILTVLAAMGVTIWLSNVTDVTQYALNIITLIGIGVSIDYSLFMVNRFREELGSGRDIKTATAMTVATAGKAVFFSGVTVAIGLMGMLFFKNTGLPSLGIGGTLAVTIAMVYSLIVLPAILSLLGTKVSSGRKLPFSFKITNDDGVGVWSKIATTVMKYPWAILIPTLIILLGAGIPFFHAEFSMASRDALPPQDEARIGAEHIDEKWPQLAANAAIVMIDFDGQDPLEEQNIRQLYVWMKDYEKNDPRVKATYGYASPNPTWTENQVVEYWMNGTTPDDSIIPREYVKKQFIAEDITQVIFSLNGDMTDSSSREFVKEVRNNRDEFQDELVIGDSGRVMVAGFAALSQDTQDAISENLPFALTFILIATFILIFLQVRSIVIPIKAIVMNILSISASFGMLVFVFQWGYGQDLLGFTPQPIEVTNPVIMFCIVFGLSMDYEILMLSRIHEEWERTGDNTLAVANGLQRTGRLITGAAAIMVVVFSAFGLSSVVILKQIGLGLALAIFIDATIVRALVVPATMRLMGKWNWWAPSWMKKN